jgi:copper chaperone NosL
MWLLIIFAFFLNGCTKDEVTKPLPIEFNREHTCAVCGMIIVDFPGAKAQIHYKGGRIDSFCGPLDMFLFYLQPDRPTGIVTIYVNDMGKAEWEHPKNHWIDAKTAFYVYGGDVMLPMGEALVPFSDLKDAENYVMKHGGKIFRFGDITMDMLRADVRSSHSQHSH